MHLYSGGTNNIREREHMHVMISSNYQVGIKTLKKPKKAERNIFLTIIINGTFGHVFAFSLELILFSSLMAGMFLKQPISMLRLLFQKLLLFVMLQEYFFNLSFSNIDNMTRFC